MTDQRQALGQRARTASLVFATAMGVAVFMALPAVIQIWIEELALTESQAGQAATSHLGALALGSGLASLLLPRLGGTRLLPMGLVLAAIGYGGLLSVSGFLPAAGAAALIGLGCGIAYGSGAALIADQAHAARLFSFLLITQVLLGAITVWLFPGLDLGAGNRSLFLALLLATLAASAAILAYGLPPMAQEDTAACEDPAHRTEARRSLVWRCLISLSVFYLAVGIAWTYAGRRALDVGIDEQHLGELLGLGNVLSLVGCLTAWWLSDRYSPFHVLATALAIVAVSFYGMGQGQGAVLFAGCLALFLLLWNLVDVYQLAALASADCSGRFVSLVPACQAIATAAGPALGAGLLTAGFGLAGLMLVCAACAAAGGLLVWHRPPATTELGDTNS